MQNLLRVFLTNFFYGGFMLGISLTIIEYFKKQQDMIYLYAYITSSFFLVQLYKYYFINDTAPELTYGFLYHSIIGSTIFVLFVMFMLYLHYIFRDKKMFSNMRNIPKGALFPPYGITHKSATKLIFWNVLLYLFSIFLYWFFLTHYPRVLVPVSLV